MQKPYVVGDGMYCDEVARFETFAEALAFYGTRKNPSRFEMRAVGIWNEALLDVDDNGLTYEETEAMNEVELMP